MKTYLFPILLLVLSLGAADAVKNLQPIPDWKPLTEAEERVIVHKGTERPYTGKLLHNTAEGTYVCKRCGTPLYRSGDKFDSHCGWPSFDDEIEGAVKRVSDKDGYRTEILCANCGAHLGHVFEGEGLTPKNVRHCVNSISMEFVPAQKHAYFAGGCFWGVEYYLEKLPGVKSVVSGYMGGHKANPTYKDVSRGDSGHLETVDVTYDPMQIDYETLAKAFFEIHDPTQKGRQGPDVGSQYESAIFVNDATEKRIIEKLIGQLEQNGYDVQTRILEAQAFYAAEAYHQDYYKRKGKLPYCHGYIKRF